MIALTAAGRVTADFGIVTGESIAHKAIFTHTGDLVLDKRVSSFLGLHTGGLAMTKITAGDKCPCEECDTVFHISNIKHALNVL